MSVLELFNVTGRRSLPLIRQTEVNECGLACIAMIAAYHGLEIEMSLLRRQYGVGLRGVTLKGVIEIAEQIGLRGRAVRLDLPEISDLRLPAILHWGMSHYVVLQAIERRFSGPLFRVYDPAKGVCRLTLAQVSEQFSGIALELTKSVNFQPQRTQSRLRIGQLWSSIHGIRTALLTTFLLSGVLQLTSLLGPFYLQTAIDTVLPSTDTLLLRTLALGFGGLAIIEVLSSYLRSLSLLSLTSAFSFQVVDNLLGHLLRLPISWFERRHVGDIVSRFNSTQPVTDLISQGLVSSALDGILAVITVIIMLVYSWELTALTIAACVLYGLIKVLSFGLMRQLNVSAITAQAKEASSFIETIRGMLTIKSFGKEDERRRAWQSLKAAEVNAQVKLGRINAGSETFATLVVALERVLFVYLAISLAIEGRLTIGMIFAFQAYKQQCLGAVTRLVDQSLHYKLINVHLTRVSDIAFAVREETGTAISPKSPTPPSIELQNVSFRYSNADPFVLKNISLKVDPGSVISLVGPSGGGKSTIIKIMMGLIEPTGGTVLIDGLAMKSVGLAQWRSQIASVLQEDRLFSGTLAENISLFDYNINYDRVKLACLEAAVWTEIEAMPLGLETFVGDMGSSLSGGQRQRVMFARALYARPQALFLDEGTANLDLATEAAIVGVLGRSSATRVISAHRPRAILPASKLLFVQGGSVREIVRDNNQD